MITNTLRNFVPLFDRVVVRRLVAGTVTKGGIMIPEKARSKAWKGTVVAVGKGHRTEKGKRIGLQVKVGDRVLLPDHGGSEVIINEKKYHVFRESEIIGKFTRGHSFKAEGETN